MHYYYFTNYLLYTLYTLSHTTYYYTLIIYYTHRFMAHGVPITISPDDPALFGYDRYYYYYYYSIEEHSPSLLSFSFFVSFKR